MLALAAASAIRPSKFRLVPRHRMPSLPELSGLLGEESWPVYSGRDDVRIHGYRSSAYGAGVHDLRHYISWKHWSEEDRKDSILLYRALRGVLSTTLPSLGSLAGRIGARLFYGDGFFHREMTALDECLSGPPGTGNGIFPQVSLANVAANLDGDKSRFHMAVEKAFAGNPREQAWRQALELVKTNGAAA